MTEKEFYPHRPAQVELRQTHISYVFLAGEYVYKVKKPVRFAFLDYSTLRKRFHFCLEEVRLNRRLAPKIYLAVVPIYQEKEGFFLAEDSPHVEPSAVREYAVKMLRLPEGQILNRLLKEGQVGKADISAIAKELVSFHLSAATEQASIYGAPEAIRRLVAENFKETECFVGKTISQKMFHKIQEYSLDFLNVHADLFKSRIQDGKVREGHGDLRAEHICLTDEIAIFDCVEFAEGLRYCDVASEVAFLAMDLDFLSAPDLSEHLAAEYAEMGHDEALSLLLPYYKCYRAYVRGKVESLKSQEQEVPQNERKGASDRSQRYFSLAYRYVHRTPRLAMLIVCGMVGTGKSTVALMLADLTGFQLLNSDLVRKRLADVSPTERVAEGYRRGIYSDSFTRLTYQTLLAEAERSLKAGRGVIVDGTFKEGENRRLFLTQAANMGIPVSFIECRAREEEIFHRLKQREKESGQVSDADWQVYLRQRSEFTSLTEIPDRIHLIVNTESDLRNSIERLVESLH
jgi:hypothetical protein